MENKNSVCYVARINEIKPIPGADNIEQGVIGGWNCIIKKGEYKVDDLVVVATTDAIIPQELSDEMGVTNYLRKGQRVRTVKLRGVYSECLIIPLYYAYNLGGKSWDEGSDMMDLLKIYKILQVTSKPGAQKNRFSRRVDDIFRSLNLGES